MLPHHWDGLPLSPAVFQGGTRAQIGLGPYVIRVRRSSEVDLPSFELGYRTVSD